MLASLRGAVCCDPGNSHTVTHTNLFADLLEAMFCHQAKIHLATHTHKSLSTGLLEAACCRRTEPAGGWRWMNMACHVMPPLISGLPPLQGPLPVLPLPLPPTGLPGARHYHADLTLYLAMLH